MDLLQTLSRMTGKILVTIEQRGNAAIIKTLRWCKSQGRTICYIPDSGGWMQYEPYARKLQFDVRFIKTEDGMIDPSTLSLEKNSVVLLHSLAGYFKRLPTKEIAAVCKRDGAIFIEDICGLISYPTYGHFVLGSFGKAKPIDFGTGGFLATDDDDAYASFKEDAITIDDAKLLEKVTRVSERLTFLYKRRDEIATGLKTHGFTTIFDDFALVIIVPFKDEEEKIRIIRVLDSAGVEHTICPRYIRSNKQAVSVEIKRLVGPF